MKKKIFLLKQLLRVPYRNETHSQLINRLIEQNRFVSRQKAVWIEIGSGFTTLMLAELADRYNAVFYSCDINLNKMNDLKEKLGEKSSNVCFVHGNSLESIPSILKNHTCVHFVFLDSAPSAMHTFQEFKIIEPYLVPGSIVIIDNAAFPNNKNLLTPCRKGKVLVPYLLASPYWKVVSHPHAGDSMVSATHMSQPEYAEKDYELEEWIDSWKTDAPL